MKSCSSVVWMSVALLLAPAAWGAAPGSGEEAGDPLARADRLFRQERHPEAMAAYLALERAAVTPVRRHLLALRLARVELARGDVHRARFRVRKVLREDPAHIPARIARARIYFYYLPERPGAVEEAERALRTARTDDPDNPAIWTELGYLAMARGRFQEALDRFQRAYERLDPQHFPAYWGRARAHLRLDERDQARAVMEACRRAGPEDPDNHWMTGNIELGIREEGRVGRALEHYLYAAGLEEAVPRYQGTAVLAHFVDGHLEEAAAIEDALRMRFPDCSWLALARGLRAEREGSLSAAMRDYRQALESDWTSAWAHGVVSNVLSGRGNRELAPFEAPGFSPFTEFEDPEEAARHRRIALRLAPELPFEVPKPPLPAGEPDQSR